MLAACGLQVDTVNDGAAALARFAAAVEAGRPYALVMLDLTVPGGQGGEDIIGRLLELDPDVRAIVSSGYLASPVMANYTQYGFSGVVTKPYTLAGLRSVLREVLGEEA